MKLLVLNQAEIEQLLPMHACIEVMMQALITLARGQLHLLLRIESAIRDADVIVTATSSAEPTIQRD
jgi:ornithine cyclodeaminase/alanine dehydrogenase-like protein (mu-crystallin family)